MIIQPKSPGLARDTSDYAKREIYKMHEDFRVNIDVSEYISNRLHRTAELMRKSGYSRSNSQSDFSDYSSSTLSSMRTPYQIANPSPECIMCMQPHN